MTERPILFSAPMVRAILAGTKTQTRRIVPMSTRRWLIDYRGPAGDTENPANWGFEDENGREWALAKDGDVDFVIPCKYGQPGDRLWVRETWAHARHAAAANCVEDGPFVYAADGEFAARERLNPRWVPGIHMFRWASRILLEIVSVRVERLQAISEADAQAEGCAYSERFRGYCVGEAEHFNSHDPRQSYFSLWEAINGAGSVEANPWVWAVEFKPLTA